MIALPSKEDPVGLTIRLLIAESRTPGSSNYDETEVRAGMVEMVATIRGRLLHPRDFCASGATDAVGIITAVCPGGGHQFAGFSKAGGQVVIEASVQKRIDDCLQRANSGSAAYQAFVNRSMEISSGHVPSQFATLTEIHGVAVEAGPFGWRTAGHDGPGGRFVAIPEELGGVLAGNQFFTLKA